MAKTRSVNGTVPDVYVIDEEGEGTPVPPHPNTCLYLNGDDDGVGVHVAVVLVSSSTAVFRTLPGQATTFHGRVVHGHHIDTAIYHQRSDQKYHQTLVMPGGWGGCQTNGPCRSVCRHRHDADPHRCHQTVILSV